VLLVPSLQTKLSVAAGPVGNWAQNRFGSLVSRTGLSGRFSLGLLLGAVWTPYVGPALGAASVLRRAARISRPSPSPCCDLALRQGSRWRSWD